MSRWRAVIVFLALLAPFWDIARPLWEVDDARYAEVPREMHERGDWITPRINYVDYIEKPPLIYWAAMISYSLFGVGEAQARLPLAAFALAALAGVFWLASWLYGRTAALFSVLILATCVQFFSLSRIITPDMALSAALLWSTGLILRCLRSPKDASWAGPAAWVAMAAAFLSKGLIGLILPGIWTAAILVFYPESRRGIKGLLLNWGTAFFFLSIGLWFLLMERTNPGFFKVFVIEQHFQRFLTAKYNRPGGWYFFLLVDLVGFLPWTPLAAGAILLPLIRFRTADSRDGQLALWVLIVLGFFTASSSKLVTYILPLFAHQSILAGRLASRLRFERPTQRAVKTAAFWIGILLFASALSAPIAARFVKTPFPISPLLTAFAMAALASFAGALLLFAKDSLPDDGSSAVFKTAAGALAALFFLVAGASTISGHLSARSVALAINRRVEAVPKDLEIRLIAYDNYLQGVPFYTHRPVDVVNWVGEMHYARRFTRFAHRFGDDDAIRALPIRGQRTFVTVPRKELRHFLSLNPAGEHRGLSEFGPWVLVEF